MGSGNSSKTKSSISDNARDNKYRSDPHADPQKNNRTIKQLDVLHKVTQSLENLDHHAPIAVLSSICNDLQQALQFPMVCDVQIKLFATPNKKEIVVSTADFKKNYIWTSRWNKINMLCSGSITLGTLTVAYRSTNNPTANQCPKDYLERLFSSDESLMLHCVSSILSTTLMLHCMQTKVAQGNGDMTGIHTTEKFKSSQREGVTGSEEEEKVVVVNAVSIVKETKRVMLDVAVETPADVEGQAATVEAGSPVDPPIPAGSKRSRSDCGVTWEMLH